MPVRLVLEVGWGVCIYSLLESVWEVSYIGSDAGSKVTIVIRGRQGGVCIVASRVKLGAVSTGIVKSRLGKCVYRQC
jgi:hypothetical protein